IRRRVATNVLLTVWHEGAGAVAVTSLTDRAIAFGAWEQVVADVTACTQRLAAVTADRRAAGADAAGDRAPTTVGNGATRDAGTRCPRDTGYIAWRPHVRACLCRRVATIGRGRAPVVAAVTTRRHVAVVGAIEVLLAGPGRVVVLKRRPIERVVLCRDDLPLG